MTFVFLTNLVNHHQIPLADELYLSLGNDYVFVAFEPLPDWLKKGGYGEIERPYILRAYESSENHAKAQYLTDTADVVMIGSAPESLVKKRLEENKVTFHYSERWFKNGYHHLLSPRVLFFYYRNHTRFRNKRSYMLCASFYTASDVSKVLAYPNKCFKWGYFTYVHEYDIERSLKERRASTLKILWVARFLKWKHPEQMLQLCEYLVEKGYDFEINMIGSGCLFEKIKSEIEQKKLDGKIHLLGNMPNAEVCEIMRQHHIFCFTSDRNEGWGAVLNEAMSNGCCPVASNMIGSAPFLIDRLQNGLLYQANKVEDLCSCVEYLIEHPMEREKMATNAYRTMKTLWNPQVAAKRLLDLSNAMLEGSCLEIDEGPCSKAE